MNGVAVEVAATVTWFLMLCAFLLIASIPFFWVMLMVAQVVTSPLGPQLRPSSCAFGDYSRANVWKWGRERRITTLKSWPFIVAGLFLQWLAFSMALVVAVGFFQKVYVWPLLVRSALCVIVFNVVGGLACAVLCLKMIQPRILADRGPCVPYLTSPVINVARASLSGVSARRRRWVCAFDSAATCLGVPLHASPFIALLLVAPHVLARTSFGAGTILILSVEAVLIMVVANYSYGGLRRNLRLIVHMRRFIRLQEQAVRAHTRTRARRYTFSQRRSLIGFRKLLVRMARVEARATPRSPELLIHIACIEAIDKFLSSPEAIYLPAPQPTVVAVEAVITNYFGFSSLSVWRRTFNSLGIDSSQSWTSGPSFLQERADALAKRRVVDLLQIGLTIMTLAWLLVAILSTAWALLVNHTTNLYDLRP